MGKLDLDGIATACALLALLILMLTSEFEYVETHLETEGSSYVSRTN